MWNLARNVQHSPRGKLYFILHVINNDFFTVPPLSINHAPARSPGWQCMEYGYIPYGDRSPSRNDGVGLVQFWEHPIAIYSLVIAGSPMEGNNH